MSGAHTGALAHRSAIERARTGVWVFLASECLVFGTLIGTYLSLHGRSTVGPYPQEVFDLGAISLATFILLASSLTMALAISAARAGQMNLCRSWIAATMVLGMAFLGMQANEYATFIREGLRLSTNVFGASFYALTGTHGTHVAAGILWLGGLLVNSFRGKLTPAEGGMVELAGLYWHFVDMVWMIIFPVVYLMEFAP